MNRQSQLVKVWDPLVRIFHWAVVIAFFTAYLTEDDFLTLHSWAGYVVLAAITIRLVWGFIGPEHARFASFVRGPRNTLQYLRDVAAGTARRTLGHNPAGAAMIVVLLVSLAITTISGVVVLGYEENAGPLAGYLAPTGSRPGLALPDYEGDEHDEDDDDRERHAEQGGPEIGELWEEIHEVFANLTLLLIVVHITGVLYSSYLHRENLVRAMFTGKKPVDIKDD
ncbi:MAG: cytochrome b/b6 domain-containing protein [Pseudomonadales bacterium]